GFLIVLGPLIFRTALRYAPWLEPLEGTFTFFRFAIAVVVLTVALFVAHKWLPAGRRRVLAILPGIVATLVLWLVAGIALVRPPPELAVRVWGLLGGSPLGHVGAVVPVWDGIDLRVGRRAQGGDAPPALRRRGGDRRHLSAACPSARSFKQQKRPPRGGAAPSPSAPPSERRVLLPDVGDALLSLRLGCGRRLRGKLQHGCLLTLAEPGQQDGLPMRKWERVMVHPRWVLVDLPKDRRLVGHPAGAQTEESGRRACDLPGKRELRSRKNAYRRSGVFLGGKATCAGTKVARREL